jgi:hypothetical protein
MLGAPILFAENGALLAVIPGCRDSVRWRYLLIFTPIVGSFFFGHVSLDRESRPFVPTQILSSAFKELCYT